MKYLKLFENFNQEITYEDVEDMLLDYIDSGDISMEEYESLKDVWFLSFMRTNLHTFLRTYVTCLVDEDNFMEDPFKSITLDTDIDEYFKVKKPNQNKDSKSIYFKVDISKKLALKFLDSSDSETKSALTDSTGGAYKAILVRRFIFKILKTIFSRFASFYINTKIFFSVVDTWSLSLENKPFARVIFRMELPHETTSSTITESIKVNEFTPDFLDVDILDDKNTKIGSFQLESYDGKNYTIIDALIEEDFRMQGHYRKSIIELLNLHPKIVIVSVFRSEEAERAWKKLLETLPEGFHFTEKHHKEENTTEFKLFKAMNFEEVEKEIFLSFEYETVDFPETELKTIQKISPEMKFTLDFYDTKNKIHFVTGYDKKSEKRKSINIEKKEDSWYLVFQSEGYPIATNYSGLYRYDQPPKNRYFVCDQFDGLTELLEKYK